jgi:transmembrane sensor
MSLLRQSNIKARAHPMSNEKKLRILFDRYMNQTSSQAEEREFMEMVDDGRYEEALKALMDSYLLAHAASEPMTDIQKQRVLGEIFKNDRQVAPFYRKKSKLLSLKPLLAAAVLLLLVSIGIQLITKQRNSEVRYSKYDGKLAPGRDMATLTLADGQKISLPNVGVGNLVAQSGVKIRKAGNGQLIYELDQRSLPQHAENDLPIRYNTISTPAGGKYQIILMDGTHVWLNSSSSLRYPISGFREKERRVELTGEAYFEVAKINQGSNHVPFVVASHGQEVEVLGTHFNIKSYRDEGLTTTTLLEGRVRVSRPNTFEQVLQPGEQAQVGSGIKILTVDTSTSVAWKNGLFKFENASIQEIMRQFSRWYDVDVEFEGRIPANTFSGEIYRDMDANKAFKLLSLADIKFRIEAPLNTGARKRIVVFSK